MMSKVQKCQLLANHTSNDGLVAKSSNIYTPHIPLGKKNNRQSHAKILIAQL